MGDKTRQKSHYFLRILCALCASALKLLIFVRYFSVSAASVRERNSVR
jgi:hypothetical protein